MQTKYQVKRNEITCYCVAEKYPHRLESTLACRQLYNNSDISADYKAGMLLDFERTEARAYNNELSTFSVRF